MTRLPPIPTLFPYTTLFRSSSIPHRCRSKKRRPSAAISRRFSHCMAFQANSLVHSQFSPGRSEEHTSELQSRENLVCRLLLEKKKNRHSAYTIYHSNCSQSS